MTEDRYRLRPSFLSGHQGPLFSLWVLPQEESRDTGVLMVPPFAEEMNRSRRMLSLQARMLAEAGFPTLMIDLFGTGDSAGEFADARVETWLQDLSMGFSALMDEGCTRVALVAVRFGALLASRLTAVVNEPISGFIFWQPVHVGRTFMTQFLRLRLASDLATGSDGLTAKQLQQELLQGHSVEVGGYELSPRLYADVQAMSLLEDMSDPARVPITLMEVGKKRADKLSPMASTLRDRWVARGVQVTALKVAGDPFWQTPEITLAPALFAPTVDAVCDMDCTD